MGWTTINAGIYGRCWGFGKLITAKEGLREIEDVDDKLEHELADCLWSVLVLADKYNIDLEKSFLKTMKGLEIKIIKSKK